ncbi:MAG: DNA starvation/stationary phase protection protein [Bacilli bacterium]|nr:DNA starvation/stationary phase protection protein [Bacilli bacterium]MBN2876274.1 DNA starvation/stationary phase protection protein [Bacilli bacterium]
MEKQVNKLNQYLSDIGVLNVKLHNLHWNVKGRGFHQAHVYLETLYDDLFEKFDEIAERIKMLGFYPKASLKEFLSTSNVQELESKDYSVTEAFQTVLDDYMNLRQKATEIRETTNAIDDFGTVSILEDHILGYDKQLWFIRSELK